jgi:transposase
MDPGQRRFQTFIDMQTGTHGELLAKYQRNGAHAAEETTVGRELEKRCECIDHLRSGMRKNKAVTRVRKRLEFQWECGRIDDITFRRKLWQRSQQQRRQKRRLLGRLYAHLHSFKLDMHYAAIRFLWEHWDTVLVSNVRMDLLCQHSRRPFGSAVAHRLLSWCHGAFRERLISSAFKRAGKYVVVTDEAYTTKTCGLCGAINNSVGTAKVFECPQCHVKIDRDVNGARNIGLRYLSRQLDG